MRQLINTTAHIIEQNEACWCKPKHVYWLNKGKEGPEFKVGNHVKILKYKNIFTKGYVPNWSEKDFLTKKS